MSIRSYFNQSENDIGGCGGGVMLLNGATGQVIWRQYTRHELFAVNCKLDLNFDTIKVRKQLDSIS